MQEGKAEQIIGVLFIVAIIVVLGSVFYLYRDDIFDPKGDSPIDNTIRTYTMVIEARDRGALVETEYQVKEGFLVKSSGKFRQAIYEEFSEAQQGHIYELLAYSDDYYLGNVSCAWNQTLCSVQVERVANPFLSIAQTSPTEAKIFIDMAEGTVIRQPVFCIEHTPDIYFLKMDLERVDIPRHLINTVDQCYMADGDIKSPKSELNISFESDGTDGTIRIVMMDKGYDLNLKEQYAIGNMPDVHTIATIK